MAPLGETRGLDQIRPAAGYADSARREQRESMWLTIRIPGKPRPPKANYGVCGHFQLPDTRGMKDSNETLPGGGLRRLRRAELPVDTLKLARYLVGKVVVHDVAEGRLSGRIVETEAYPMGDPASHAFRGKTPHSSSMFLGRGHAHVYLTYGSSFMLNVVSEVRGVGAGVLLRALEPLAGIDLMQCFRAATRLIDLTRGPGRLTEAMGIDLRQDGVDLCAAGPLWLATTAQNTGAIGESVRIGLTRNVDPRWRFYERGNPHVSGLKRLRE